MEERHRKTFLRPISRGLNRLSSGVLIRGTQAILGADSSFVSNGLDTYDSVYDDETLAPVMPAIDAVQQLIEEENRSKAKEKSRSKKPIETVDNGISATFNVSSYEPIASTSTTTVSSNTDASMSKKEKSSLEGGQNRRLSIARSRNNPQDSPLPEISLTSDFDVAQDDEIFMVRNYPIQRYINPNPSEKQEEYEFIPKSVILDVYSNDPEVKRFLKQLSRIGTESGFNEQDYKCYSCRRPIGMVFGQSRLCHFDGHHYCFECHLNEKSTIPARILCNWDFKKYPISKRNQHFLTLISNEPMFKLKTIAPLLYKTCPELKEIEELRYQAFFVRSYCFTCVQESVSFELTKLVWPREHLIKQTDSYSTEDLIQIKSGALKCVLKNVIAFGRQHVLTCVLCCQKGFICEICKSSQIIYPFDTDSVYRCNSCQSIYHKNCFREKPNCDECPRCQRLIARRNNI